MLGDVDLRRGWQRREGPRELVEDAAGALDRGEQWVSGSSVIRKTRFGILNEGAPNPCRYTTTTRSGHETCASTVSCETRS